MKNIILILLSASILTSYAVAADDTIVASYTGNQVKELQVMQQFRQILDSQLESKGKSFSSLPAELQENLVKMYVDAKLVELEALSSGLEKKPEFQEKLNIFKNQMLVHEFIDNYLKDAVNDQAFDKEYKQQVDNLKNKQAIKVRHILVPTEKAAVDLENQLKKGAKFSALIKHSTDEATKAKGGEIDEEIVEGMGIVPEFEKAALALKKGQVSAPVKTQFGWHIIEAISDKHLAKAPSKEEAKPKVMAKLRQESLRQYIGELEKKADYKLIVPAPSTQAK